MFRATCTFALVIATLLAASRAALATEVTKRSALAKQPSAVVIDSAALPAQDAGRLKAHEVYGSAPC